MNIINVPIFKAFKDSEKPNKNIFYQKRDRSGQDSTNSTKDNNDTNMYLTNCYL